MNSEWIVLPDLTSYIEIAPGDVRVGDHLRVLSNDDHGRLRRHAVYMVVHEVKSGPACIVRVLDKAY